jgi:hypothetical protein
MARKTPVEEELKKKLHIHEHTEHCSHGPHDEPATEAGDLVDEDEEDFMNSEAFRQWLIQQQTLQHQAQGGHQHSGCCGHDHDHHHGHGFMPATVNQFSDKSKFVVLDQQEINGIVYKSYNNEDQLKMIMDLISKDLSEPYSIYTYRYFIYNWPHLCFLVGISLIHYTDYL